MPIEDGCPPPTVFCNDDEYHCWEPATCDGPGCWDIEFCAPLETGCPVKCYEDEMICSMPPPPDCDEFGSGCAPDEFCVPMEEGCPPPPVYCDFATEEMCYTPPPPDCEGSACWGTEFCAPMETGCPMPPLDCNHDQVQCADPPPPTYCDWETEVLCYEPPADCTGEMCWPTEFCAPIEPGCPMMEGEWPEADEDDGYWLMALGKKNHHGRKRSHTHKVWAKHMFAVAEKLRQHKWARLHKAQKVAKKTQATKKRSSLKNRRLAQKKSRMANEKAMKKTSIVRRVAEKTSEKAKKAKASQKVRVGQYKEYVRLVHVAQMRFAKVRFAPK